MILPTHSYPGKILLFGEYTVLLGSNALAIPFTKCGGKWSDGDHLLSLLDFYEYLSQAENIDFLDAQKLKFLKRTNKKIDSNIPMGYGAGSSGCVVAAVYDFCKKEELSLQKTKSALGIMESFFHGSSSGMDPLVSLLRQPIVQSDSNISLVSIASHDDDHELFLLDTRIRRETSELVNRFKKEIENKDFLNSITAELIPEVNKSITSYINGNLSGLFACFKKINQFQSNHFSWLIPADFQYLFNSGAENSSFSLKICGAGGGGYLLGIRQKGYRFESTIEQNIQRLI